MKKITFKLATLALLAVLTGCNNSGNNSTINSQNGATTISIKDGNSSVQIKHAGTIKLNDNETAIASISPGGYLNYSNNGKEMIAKSDAKGVVTYTLRENGGQLDANDATGQRFITQILREMYSYGYNLPERRDALYQAGGQTAVLAEIANLKNDEMKESTLDFLLKKVNPVTQPEEFAAILNAVNSIQSDNAKSKLLDKMTRLDGKTDEQWIAVIDAASRIKATAEKTNVMVGIGQKMPKNDALKAAYLKAAKTITAEAEYARVVNTIK
jgi:hypothetical protein